MPIEVEVRAKPVNEPLHFEDLQAGDVFTWGNGATWYVKTAEGYVNLNSAPPRYMHDSSAAHATYPDLRLGVAKVTIEE